MNFRGLLTVIVVLVAVLASAHQRVGLVLSGGGAKGVAHIGVIKALEDNDIPIDYVAGTSMGAIISGLYAAGYSPDEMLALVCSDEFDQWATGTISPDLRYYFTTPHESPKMLSLPLFNDSVARSLPQSLISPVAMNFPFMRLFAAQTAAAKGDFNKLFVPLRTVSSNIKAQRGEVARSGQLTEAVRASMSIPLVFCPVEINDTLHYDGGIFNNFPVDVMKRDFHPDIMIGVDVHTPAKHEVPNFVNQTTDLATRPQTYALDSVDGIKIHIDLNRFTMLDFKKAREIYEIGYRRGLSMVDSIKSRVTSRRSHADVARRREDYRASLPTLTYDRVECQGGTPAQNAYIASQFHHRGRYMTLEAARTGYYRALSGDLLSDLKVESVQGDSSRFTLMLKAYPKSPWSVDVGAFVTTSTSSMLYGALNFRTLKARSVNTSLGAWLGQDYMASQLLADIRFGGENPYSLGLQGVVSRHLYSQSEKMFYQFNDPKFVREMEAFGRANLINVAVGRHGAAHLSAGYGYHRSTFRDEGGWQSMSSHKLWQFAMRYDYNTLDGINYPTEGLEIHTSLAGMTGHRSLNSNTRRERFAQLDARVRKFWDCGRHFAFGAVGELLASTRKWRDNEEAAYADAPAYQPTPSCVNAFNPSFRAYSFLAVGAVPVWRAVDRLQVRGDFHLFTPWRDSRVRTPEFFGEASAVYSFKAVNLSAFINYRTGSVTERGWHVGITLGVLKLAPEFLR